MYQAKSKAMLSDCPHSHGAVSWFVEARKESIGNPEQWDIYSSLRIQDCHEHITLEFSVEHKSLDKRLAKIDVLLKELTDMRAALVKAGKYVKPATVY